MVNDNHQEINVLRFWLDFMSCLAEMLISSTTRQETFKADKSLMWNKYNKLSYRREAARASCCWNVCCHSVTRHHSNLHCWVQSVCVRISISSQLCLYLVPFLRYSTSYNGVPLNYWLGITRRHWDGTIRWVTYAFLLALLATFPYLVSFTRQSARDVRGNHEFFIPHLQSTSPLTASPSGYCDGVCCQSTRRAGLPESETKIEDVMCTVPRDHAGYV